MGSLIKNLILQYPSTQWEVVNFSKAAGTWFKTQEGFLAQSVRSTETKLPGGTALLYQPEDSFVHDAIGVETRPGTVYHTGLVFNFLDRNNFSLFFINNLSTSYEGYQISVVKIQNAAPEILVEKKYFTNFEDKAVLSIRKKNSRLSFRFNEEVIFEWDAEFIARSRCGLYTQQNNDAEFHQFIAGTMEDLADSNSLLEVPANREPVRIIDDGLSGYLKIKAPFSESQIEFHEVFNVPLDGFYVSLFNNTKLIEAPQVYVPEKAAPQGVISVGSLIRKINFEGKWYKLTETVGPSISLYSFSNTESETNVYNTNTLNRESGYTLPILQSKLQLMVPSSVPGVNATLEAYGKIYSDETNSTSKAQFINNARPEEESRSAICAGDCWLHLDDEQKLLFRNTSGDAIKLDRAFVQLKEAFLTEDKSKIVTFDSAKPKPGYILNVWNAQTGAALCELRVPQVSRRVSPDGKRILVPDAAEQVVVLFSLVTGEKIQSFYSTSTPPEANLQYTFEGNVAQFAGSLRIWNGESGSQEKTMSWQSNIAFFLCLKQNEILFASVDTTKNDNKTYLFRWNYKTDVTVNTLTSFDLLQPGSLIAHSFLSNTSELMLQLGTGKVVVLNLSNLTIARQFANNRTESLKPSTDATKLCTGFIGNGLAVFSLADGKALGPAGVNVPPNTRMVAISPSGKLAALQSTDMLTFYIWHLDQLKSVKTISCEFPAQACGFTDTDRKFIYSEAVAKAYIAHPGSAPVELPATPSSEMQILFSPDSKYGLLGRKDYATGNSYVEIWDIEAIRKIKRLDWPTRARQLAWASNDQVGCGTDSGKVQLYHVKNDTFLTFDFPAGVNKIRSISASSSILLAVAEEIVNGVLQFTLFTVKIQTTAEIPTKLTTTTVPVEGSGLCALSRDAATFLFCSKNSLVKVYTIKTTGAEVLLTIGIPESVDGLGFSASGNEIWVKTTTQLLLYKLRDADTTTTVPQVALPHSYSKTLDYRPEQWYRAYKTALEDELFFTTLGDNCKVRMAELNTWPAPTTASIDDVIASRMKKAREYKNQYSKLQTQRYKAREAQQAITQQAKVNGYNIVNVSRVTSGSATTTKVWYYAGGREVILKDVNIDNSLITNGYDFAITGGVPELRNYAPQAIPEMEWKSDGEWQAFVSRFEFNLQEAIGPEKKALFREQANELTSFGSSSWLKLEQKRIETEILSTAKSLEVVKSDIQKYEQDLEKWTADLSEYRNLIRTFVYQKEIENARNLYDLLNQKKFNVLKFEMSYQTREEQKSYQYTNYGFWPWEDDETIVVTYSIMYNDLKIAVVESNRSTEFRLRWDFNTSRGVVSAPVPSGFAKVRDFISYIENYLTRTASLTKSQVEKSKQEVKSRESQLAVHRSAITDLRDNGLPDLRKRFVAYWNDPALFGAYKVVNNAVLPDDDPLTDLIVSLKYDTKKPEVSKGYPAETQIDYFSFQNDRYSSQEGLSIPVYLELIRNSRTPHVAIFPRMREDGRIDRFSLQAVVNPEPGVDIDVRLPVIKFIETYKTYLRWTGFHLGELTHTENLFPGEKKEIVVEKTTRLVIRQEQSRSDTSTNLAKTSNSFEENLQKEFSNKYATSSEQETTTEQSEKQASDHRSTTQQNSSEDFSLDIDLTMDGGPLADVLGVSGSMGSKFATKESTQKTDDKRSTFERATSTKGKTANKESRESFAKEVSNTIRKVVSETSQENKVEIRVSTSEESTSTSSRREVVTMENPNTGRTLNYNFYQAQNVYELRTVLTDVKIVLDPNVEAIKGSGVADVRVFELEEVGKILSSFDSPDSRAILTAAIVARQAFKNYLTGTGNGALRITEPFLMDETMMAHLNFSGASPDSETIEEDILMGLQEALSYLKKVPFVFQPVTLQQPETYAINSGSYYLDSEVGRMPATEKYLEERRELESEMKKAEIENVKRVPVINPA